MNSLSRNSTVMKVDLGQIIFFTLILILFPTYAHGKSITFSWPSDLVCEHSVKEKELLLQCNGEMQVSDLRAFLDKTSEWIEAVNTGYDSIQFKTKVPFIIKSKKNGVTFLFRKEHKNTSTTDLDIVKARLHILKGDIKLAYKEIDPVLAKHPNNAEALLAKASAVHQTGKWRYAIALLDKAIAIEPDNENISDMKEVILSEHRSFARVTRDIEFTGDTATERMTRFYSKVRVAPYTSLGMEIERNDLDVISIRRASDGRIESFNGNKTTGEVYISHDYENGDEIKGSIFAGGYGAGVGVEYAIPNIKGKTVIEVAYNKPYLDFIEGVIGDSAVDTISLSKTHKLTEQLSGVFTGSLNRYGLNGIENIAGSYAFEGSLNYTFPPENNFLKSFGKEGYVAVSYFVDAEYMLGVKSKLDTNGVFFKPLPIASREVHAVNLFFKKDHTQHFYSEWYGGYSYDRLGGRGPMFGGSIIYKHKKGREIRFSLARNVSTEISSTTVERAVIDIVWNF